MAYANRPNCIIGFRRAVLIGRTLLGSKLDFRLNIKAEQHHFPGIVRTHTNYTSWS
ncbi:hypothetical protein PGTUg99_002542 [Puccinia graminis f. sp. tritici]|uniref:Uncharacterized protein n=1 Tax=Puccinia graminis f. sp. tritici TaxID=56615 RepID=A0A5B0R7Z7_PUCGR|nr:hypothetical protein PGTUg99_002542 [Puccinia graminis f. sp. tritici]